MSERNTRVPAVAKNATTGPSAADRGELIDAPENASDKQIRRAVTSRAHWIHGHLTAIRLRRAHVLPREYVSGESLLYLGRRYRLKVLAKRESPVAVRLWGGY